MATRPTAELIAEFKAAHAALDTAKTTFDTAVASLSAGLSASGPVFVHAPDGTLEVWEHDTADAGPTVRCITPADAATAQVPMPDTPAPAPAPVPDMPTPAAPNPLPPD